ncbi:MAG: hypothetical protein N2039_01690, partial [Gemmataceae bacterium]|nr:hypothetical protein [Gemmataceae bacterium]
DVYKRQTEIRASRLDFLRAAPEKPTRFRLILGALALFLLAAPLALWPRAYAEKIRRFALPWVNEPVRYELRYSQDDVAIARGQAVTLAAHLVPLEPNAVLPQEAWLIIRDQSGQTKRLGMSQEQSHVFYLRLKDVQDSFEYRIESGRAAGPERRVRVVDPVRLEVNSPTITIVPPEYARGESMPPPQQGMFDLSCLQFSRLIYEFRFDRSARKAFVTWTAEDVPGGNRTELELSPDGKTAKFELIARQTGRLALTIVGEEDVRTEVPPQTINVVVDRAPAFARSVGAGEQLRVLSTEDKLELDVAVVDDIGVSGAELEFRIDEGPIQKRPLALEGVGTPQAQTRFAWRLADHAHDGQTVQFRIRATDNRNIPEANLGPQSVYAPAENRWFAVKLTREAQPLRQQEITAQRDEIRKRLDELIEELHGERRRLYKARAESNQAAQMTPDVAEQLRDLRKEHQQNEKSLDELTRQVDQIPELRPLAHRLQDVSDQEMRQTANALASAERERQASAPRDSQLGQADQALESAVKKLEELKQQNDRLAEQRLDRMRVEQLAEREQRLAEQAASSPPEKRSELANQQAALENELNSLMNSSEPLRQALQAAQAQRAQELAEKARELAHQQRELAQAIDQSQREFMRSEVGELAQRQRELAEKANRLGQETQQAVAAAQSRPLESDKARDAAKELEQGNIADALSKQEQSAQELDRLANDLQRAIDLARDPKEAAKQLARWQNDLKNRVQEEAKDWAPDPVDPERLKEWRQEQESLRRAAAQVPVPEKDSSARREKQEALDRAADAGRDLEQGDTAKATANMEKARQAIERLADRLPNMQQRWAAARDEVHRLRKEQEELARQGEQLAASTPPDSDKSPEAATEQQKRVSDAARKQADLLDRFNRLDLPGFQPRQERVRRAMEQALDDLQSGQRADAAIAQAEAKRQLERLEQALNGQRPVDEKVAELARRQQDLATRAEQNRQSSEAGEARNRQAQQLAEEQKRLAQEVANLPPTEANQRQSQAVEAAKKAESASRQGPQPFAEAAAQAAQRLADWARQLDQGEADAARARRLADQLRELANQAEQKNEPRAIDELRKKQQPIQDEARQIRSGPDATREKQKAADALAELSRKPSEQLPAAQRQAADALQELADRLTRRDSPAPAERPSPRSAEELAQLQQRLMEQTREARREAAQRPAEQSGRAAKEMARQQGQLRNEAARLPRQERTNALSEAREAMRQAERALDRGDWEQAEQQQQAASRALERLAQEVARNRPEPGEPNPAGLPRPEQVDQARQLAQQQRELRDAVQRAVSQRTQQDRDAAERMLRELTQEQQAIADAAAEMARQQQPGTPQAQKAQDAATSARQARQQLQNGSFNAARQSGESTGEQLRRLAEASEGAQARDAQGLAQRQDALNQRLAQLADDPVARQAQQGLRQQELQRQAAELGRQLAQQAEQAQGEPREAFRQAAQSAQRADNLMQQAQQRQSEGNATARRLAQRLAARDLERAAQAAQRASGQPANEEQAPAARRQLGSALQQAQAQMRQAREQLGQNQPQNAQQAMQNAAQALQKAARSFDARNSPGQPPLQANGEPQNDGSASGAAIDLTRYGPDAVKYKGKPWGELPGELRTRIIQDMKAQFGDDYGRMIKLYFEQIADRKPMDRP